jgi:O-antigen ligase
MPPILALFLGLLCVLYALRSDRSRYPIASKALIWPTLWYMATACHPLGFWLQLWHIPMPGDSADPTDGSIVDRTFYAILAVIGLWILSRRGFDWRAAFRDNPWLAAFLAFMALSILWSHYPFVSFKRFIKVIGSIVMALIILTDGDPLGAFTTVLRRVLYIHLPMSIICIKYFRDIGVGYDWSGTSESWQGISTSKNVLGQVAMISVVYFFWEVKRNWAQYRWRNIHILYLGMALHLLNGAKADSSKTSIAVGLFALIVFIRLQMLRSRPQYIGPFVKKAFFVVASAVSMVLLHSVFLFSADSPFGEIISIIGRDITLTGRTYIWSDVYAAASANPLFGVGFGGFWIGRLANIPWNANMTWVLAQAHSGYVDTYLQIGLIGSFLLAGLLFSSVPRLIASLDEDYDFGCLKIAFFLMIVFVNMTETIYLRGDHHLWLILMIVLWRVPKGAQPEWDESEEFTQHAPESEEAESVHNCA